MIQYVFSEWFYKNYFSKDKFEILQLHALEDVNRKLFPISYLCVIKNYNYTCIYSKKSTSKHNTFLVFVITSFLSLKLSSINKEYSIT